MSTPGQSRLSVRKALRDRCLTVVGLDEATSMARYLDTSRGGLVISSTRGIGKVRGIHATFPGLVIASDPKAPEVRAATAETPVDLPDSGMLGQMTLEQVISDQFSCGADIAVVPGRHIEAEDSTSLRALIDAANTVDRDDVIVRVPCAYPWLRPENHRQLAAILGRSRHPVALSPAGMADPLENPGVPAGLRMITEAIEGLIIWKTDLAGLDAVAHGALATAIGVIPSLRHSVPPGGRGRAIDKSDRQPKILLPKLLRYVRSSLLHDQWFVSAKPWTCDCPVCHGRAVDRFTSSKQDLFEAAVHNSLAITGLHRELTALPAEHRGDLWREKLQEAEIAHVELSAYIERKLPFPAVLQYWLDNS
jgi:hypothetical protein